MPSCSFCKKPIPPGAEFHQNADIPTERLHAECLQKHMEKKFGRCAFCNDVLSGDIIEIKMNNKDRIKNDVKDDAGDDEDEKKKRPERNKLTLKFHADCLEQWKIDTRDNCMRCNKPILDQKYIVYKDSVGEDDEDFVGDFGEEYHYHEKCWLAQLKEDRAPEASKKQKALQKLLDEGKSVPKEMEADKGKLTGRCNHCILPIYGSEYVESPNTTMPISGPAEKKLLLHNECVEEYSRKNHGTCHVCGKLVGAGETMLKVPSAPHLCFHHEPCFGRWKEANRPTCEVCNEVIIDPRYITDETYDKHYHKKCWLTNGQHRA